MGSVFEFAATAFVRIFVRIPASDKILGTAAGCAQRSERDYGVWRPGLLSASARPVCHKVSKNEGHRV